MRFPHATLLAAAMTLLGVATPARAQDDAPSRRPALVFAGPSSVGLILPVTARLAVRPDLSLTRTTFNIASSESKFVTAAVGIAVLVSLRDFDGVQTYVAPRVALSRNTFDDGSITDLWFFDAAFGVSAPLTRRFALFGEVGPRVTYTDQSTPALVNRTTNAVIRSALGAAFTF